MAQTVSPVTGPFGEEQRPVDPNQFIIWLDQYIGQDGEYIMLKSTFILAMNPTNSSYERTLNKDDIDRSILIEAPLLVQIDNVEFLLQAFDDVEKCFKTIEKNLTKRIFLITSGSKGKILIPSLMANFPDTFVSEYWMYVFCSNMNMIHVKDVIPANQWALNFLENILMFNHPDDLLTRMVYDMANYFSTKATDLENNRQQNNDPQQGTHQRLENARQHLSWSTKMYQRYGTMTSKHMNVELTAIDQRVHNIQLQLKQEQRNDEEDNVGEPCDE